MALIAVPFILAEILGDDGASALAELVNQAERKPATLEMVPPVLREKLGQEATEALVQLINDILHPELQEQKDDQEQQER